MNFKYYEVTLRNKKTGEVFVKAHPFPSDRALFYLVISTYHVSIKHNLEDVLEPVSVKDENGIVYKFPSIEDIEALFTVQSVDVN